MSYSQKYTIVQFLQSAPDEFFSMNEWPLHLTVADVFSITLTTAFFEELRSLCIDTNRVKTIAQKNATLGTEQDSIDVVLVKNNLELQSLHNALVDMLERHRAVFNIPAYIREGFLPHVTIKKPGDLAIDTDLIISELSLVDMFVDDDWQKRHVIGAFPLNLA